MNNNRYMAVNQGQKITPSAFGNAHMLQKHHLTLMSQSFVVHSSQQRAKSQKVLKSDMSRLQKNEPYTLKRLGEDVRAAIDGPFL